GDVPEVAGNERQHAGRQERHQPRGERDRHGEQQRPVEHGLPHACRGHRAGTLPDRTSSTRSTRVSLVVAPLIRAAMRPCASTTTVVGTALAATTPRSASRYWVESNRLG